MIVSADKAMYERKSRRKMIYPPRKQQEPQHQRPMPTPAALPPEPLQAETDNFIVELDESHVVVSGAVN
jgi:hypothetical protein